MCDRIASLAEVETHNIYILLCSQVMIILSILYTGLLVALNCYGNPKYFHWKLEVFYYVHSEVEPHDMRTDLFVVQRTDRVSQHCVSGVPFSPVDPDDRGI